MGGGGERPCVEIHTLCRSLTFWTRSASCGDLSMNPFAEVLPVTASWATAGDEGGVDGHWGGAARRTHPQG